jgi:hypothetical protein
MNTLINFGARGGNAAVVDIDNRRQNQLVRNFDDQLAVRKQNRLELGRVARELKPLYVTHGQRQKGRGWEAFLEERGLSRSTVDEWILDYERSIGARERKSVLPESGRTNVDNKEDSGTPSRSMCDSKPSHDDEESGLELEPEALESVISKVNPLDRLQGRSDWLFKNALDVFERANKASGQALHEWDDAAARVRKVLASYKKDEVDNPHADFSPIAASKEE